MLGLCLVLAGSATAAMLAGPRGDDGYGWAPYPRHRWHGGEGDDD